MTREGLGKIQFSEDSLEISFSFDVGIETEPFFFNEIWKDCISGVNLIFFMLALTRHISINTSLTHSEVARIVDSGISDKLMASSKKILFGNMDKGIVNAAVLPPRHSRLSPSSIVKGEIKRLSSGRTLISLKVKLNPVTLALLTVWYIILSVVAILELQSIQNYSLSDVLIRLLVLPVIVILPLAYLALVVKWDYNTVLSWLNRRLEEEILKDGLSFNFNSLTKVLFISYNSKNPSELTLSILSEDGVQKVCEDIYPGNSQIPLISIDPGSYILHFRRNNGLIIESDLIEIN